MIRILKPGMLTTVQDLGRHGYTHWGIAPAGAADPVALRAGNRILGNPESAAALEITMLGPHIEFLEDHLVAITGGDAPLQLFDPSSAEEHTRPVWSTFLVTAGQVLRIGPLSRGSRLYLCVHGGIHVPDLLGSRASYLPGNLGPAPLQRDDLLAIGPAPDKRPRLRRLLPALHLEAWREAAHLGYAPLRVTPGPQFDDFSDSAQNALLDADFEVAGDSDRLGLRLAGPHIDAPFDGQMPTQGVPLGAVQIPPSGQPILLGVDAQTTGGYPILASVISADLWKLGQLRPRDKVRFQPVLDDEARRLLLAQEVWLAAT